MPDGPFNPGAAAVRERRLDLDRAKGIAILLVVFGHIVARQQPEGLGWYEPLRFAVYRFHMPLFFYLSGTVAMLSGVLATPPARWAGLLEKRAMRLLLPFFAVGLLILLGKLAAAQVTATVDNAPDGFGDGLRHLFWDTAASPATSIWYLLVLFLATLVAVPAMRCGLGTSFLVGLGLVLQFLPVPAVLYLDRFASHFIFFAMGLWVAQRQDWLLPAFTRQIGLWCGLFLASLALAEAGILPEAWSLLVCGLLALPAVHALVRAAPINRLRWPLWFGRYSMVIYLFNTIAIGLAKAVLVALGVGWTVAGFWLHAPVLMAAGILLPVLFKQLVLVRLPAVDRLTD
jgi:fucose 4-O-acetylase-like acetyltransferase